MKVLVIPDVHLKPWMFEQAAVLMRAKKADCAVCLMDIPDDWGKEYDIALYEQTYDAAIDFAKEFPETAWCYGNHDLSYLWHRLESGYSSMAAYTVQRKLLDLRDTLPENNPICYVQKIDNVLFSHAGVLERALYRKQNIMTWRQWWRPLTNSVQTKCGTMPRLSGSDPSIPICGCISRGNYCR